MAENIEPPIEPSDPQTQLVRQAQPDWFLQMLVEMANKGILSLDMTVQVSGLLVSGQMIGGGDYFDGMGEDFGKAFPADAEQMKATFAALRDQYYPKNIDDAMPGPSYIHLKNARFFNTAGNPIPGNRGVWWRGRLSEVGGFVIGGLS